MRKAICLMMVWILFSCSLIAQTNIGSVKTTKHNGEVNLALVAGAADVCAAAASQPAATPMYLPAGNYTCTNKLMMAAYTSLRAPAGAQQTNITYNGSGIALETTGGNTIDGISLIVGTSATDGFKLKGENITLKNFYLQGGASTTKMIHVAAYDATTLSGVINIKNGSGFGINGIGSYVDHATDVFISDVDLYFGASNTTTGMIVDTGTSGLYLKGFSAGGATQGGLVVKNSTGGAGAYNAWPENLFINKSIFDCAGSACSTADAIKFDSTLSTNPMYASLNDTWAAGYGLNGIHISGGQGYVINGGSKIRSNGLNGILIDNSNVSDVNILGNFVTANNTSNNADGHGVYISAASTNVTVSGNTIRNALDTTGHQKYGIKIAAVLADKMIATNNKLYPNDTGTISNANTGVWSFAANNCLTTDTGCRDRVSGDIEVVGNAFIDSSLFAANLGATSTLQINGVTVVDSTKKGIFAGGVQVGGGSNVVYRCSAAGTLPIGALTTNSANCGTAVATTLTVN